MGCKILIITYFIGENYNSIGKIKRWLNNILLNVFINSNRRIIIITDNTDAIKQLKCEFTQDFINFYNFNYKIDNYYYLCIKYHLIFDCSIKYRDDYNYICFCQSNFIATKNIYVKDLINNDQKLQLLIHPYYKYNRDNFMHLYGDNAGTTVDIKNYINDFNSDWIYYQSGFSIYKPDMLYWLYNEINNRILIDFYNSKRVEWHDETYLNYVINVLVKNKKIISLKEYKDKNMDSDFYFIDKKRKDYLEL